MRLPDKRGIYWTIYTKLQIINCLSGIPPFTPSNFSLPNVIPPIVDIVPDHLQRTLRHLLIGLLQQRLPRRQRLLVSVVARLPLPLRHSEARVVVRVVLLELELPFLVGSVEVVAGVVGEGLPKQHSEEFVDEVGGGQTQQQHPDHNGEADVEVRHGLLGEDLAVSIGPHRHVHEQRVADRQEGGVHRQHLHHLPRQVVAQSELAGVPPQHQVLVVPVHEEEHEQGDQQGVGDDRADERREQHAAEDVAVALGEVHGLVLEVEVGFGLGYRGPVGDLPALEEAVGVAVVEEGGQAGEQRIGRRQKEEVVDKSGEVQRYVLVGLGVLAEQIETDQVGYERRQDHIEQHRPNKPLGDVVVVVRHSRIELIVSEVPDDPAQHRVEQPHNDTHGEREDHGRTGHTLELIEEFLAEGENHEDEPDNTRDHERSEEAGAQLLVVLGAHVRVDDVAGLGRHADLDDVAFVDLLVLAVELQTLLQPVDALLVDCEFVAVGELLGGLAAVERDDALPRETDLFLRGCDVCAGVSVQQVLHHQPYRLLVLAALRLYQLNSVFILADLLEDALALPHIGHPLLQRHGPGVDHHDPVLLLEGALVVVDLPLAVVQLQVLLAVVDEVDLDEGGVGAEVAELLIHELLDVVEGDVLGQALQQNRVVSGLVLELDPAQVRELQLELHRLDEHDRHEHEGQVEDVLELQYLQILHIEDVHYAESADPGEVVGGQAVAPRQVQYERREGGADQMHRQEDYAQLDCLEVEGVAHAQVHELAQVAAQGDLRVVDGQHTAGTDLRAAGVGDWLADSAGQSVALRDADVRGEFEGVVVGEEDCPASPLVLQFRPQQRQPHFAHFMPCSMTQQRLYGKRKGKT